MKMIYDSKVAEAIQFMTDLEVTVALVAVIVAIGCCITIWNIMFKEG